jgi:hypothetical protein
MPTMLAEVLQTIVLGPGDNDVRVARINRDRGFNLLAIMRILLDNGNIDRSEAGRRLNTR